MKILSPLNNPEEIAPLIEAGADEIYCGVLDEKWRKSYTNIGSINRREWTTSNLESYSDLSEVVEAAHKYDVKVYLTLNSLYTAPQYDDLKENFEEIKKIPVDALIIADPGLMIYARENGWDGDIHVSTGGTVFNSLTARFYKKHFNVSRIVIPRHNNLNEIQKIAKAIDFLETECFIFNSGCKNIDGFCTYHHGTNEIIRGDAYKIPKKLGLDYLVLKYLRSLPDGAASKITRIMNFKSDSACLLAWNAEPEIVSGWDEKAAKSARKWIESTFCLRSGLDPCGACAIPAIIEAGVTSVKIVGRENPSYKKILDVKFLKKIINLYENMNSQDKPFFKDEAKNIYREIYGAQCREWCYYPD